MDIIRCMRLSSEFDELKQLQWYFGFGKGLTLDVMVFNLLHKLIEVGKITKSVGAIVVGNLTIHSNTQ